MWYIIGIIVAVAFGYYGGKDQADFERQQKIYKKNREHERGWD